MCSPKIMEVVRKRLEKEGPPAMSRRNLLRLGGGLAAGAAVAASRPLPVLGQDMMNEVVDLSHVMGESAPHIFGPDFAPVREKIEFLSEVIHWQQWSFNEHSGTHVDIPSHFILDGGENVDTYDANLLVGRAVVIDISARAEEDSDAFVTVEDIQAWEGMNGEVPPGALVCMHSGWEAHWSDPAAFINRDGDGVAHFPGFGEEAAALLVEERDIHGIAVDTPSQDPGNSATFPVHYITLGAGLYGIENVRNLPAIMDRAATVVVGVPRWEGGSGGPCRVLALT